MRPHMPRSPFTTRLSSSARETEQRIRSIVQWKKRRPPVLLLLPALLLIVLCGGLVSCQVRPSETETAGHTLTRSFSLTDTRTLTLELSSNVPHQDHTLSPLEELRIYEGNTLLQTISAKELAASNQQVRAYDWRTNQVEAYPISSLDTDAQYLYEGLFFLDDPGHPLDGPMTDDFNFDGYTDFALPVFSTPGRNAPYAFFLWNAQTEQYVFSFLMFSAITLDEESKQLTEISYYLDLPEFFQYTFDEEGFLCTAQEEPVPYSGPNEAAQTFLSVLQGHCPFIYAEDSRQTSYYLTQLNEVLWGDPNVEVYPEQFAVADLDDDGTQEVIILTNLHVSSEPILILRWQDGQIYGYPEVGRGMQQLKADGTSEWSNSAFVYGSHRDVYIPEGSGPHRREQLCLSEYVGNGVERYSLNGQQVTQAEFEAFQAAQDAKPDARRYCLNGDNRDAVFSSQTGGTP